MPMLKTVSAGKGSVVDLQRYLVRPGRQDPRPYQEEIDLYEQGRIFFLDSVIHQVRAAAGDASRALSVDVSDDLTTRNWGRQMDLTRLCFNHDGHARSGKSRSYYHFILSPDPADDCTLETLRAYAKAWAEANFRNAEQQHEFAIVPHDDNTTGVLHAHIVVNVTDKAGGRKLHLDNDEVVGLQHSAQKVGLRFGLTPLRRQLETAIGARTQQPIYLDRQEREMLNRGKITWKWELRQVISALAPLSDSFQDFREKLQHAGFDVSASSANDVLVYTHRNGMQVKDSRLGSRFYRAALEKCFRHELLVEDAAYNAWEEMKFTKGQVRWKADIRHAIDVLSPTVNSIPELQEALQERYGIRLTVNRRGFRYRHPAGFSAADASLGFRFTPQGLRHSRGIVEKTPYPGFDDILRQSAAVVKNFLPRLSEGPLREDPQWTAMYIAQQDMAQLMVGRGIASVREVQPALRREQDSLAAEKQQIAQLRGDLMRCNRLLAYEKRLKADSAHPHTREPSSDSVGYRDALSADYHRRLDAYSDRFDRWSRDTKILQNYLMCGSPSYEEIENAGVPLDAEALFRAGNTLAGHNIRDYFHLQQMVSGLETKLEISRFKLDRAEKTKAVLERTVDDIRTYTELSPVVRELDGEQAASPDLDRQTNLLLFNDAHARLKQLRVREADFAQQHEEYRRSVDEYTDLARSTRSLSEVVEALKDAQRVCVGLSDSIKNASGHLPLSRSSEGGREGRDQHAVRAVDPGQKVEPTKHEPLPLEEAKRRQQERLRQAPQRHVRHNEQQL